MSAPKGLTWPKFRSWYTKNIGGDDVSKAWLDYKNGVKQKTNSKKAGRGDQDEWDEMGNTLNMINDALKKTKQKKTLPKITPAKKRGAVKSRISPSKKGSPSKYTEEEKKKFFKKGSKLNEGQKKYCRCVLEVENAVNPWATCAKTTGNSYHNCGQEYDWYNLPSTALRNYARNSKIKINKNDTDDQVRQKINEWKQKKYGESI